MDPLHKLLAIEDIRRLKARYFRAVDTRDWPLLREVVSEDVTLDFRGATRPTGDEHGDPFLRDGGEVLHGRAAAISGLDAGLRGVDSIHRGFLPEIEILDEETATGVWPMHDILILTSATPSRRLRGWGHYHESYRIEDGFWRLFHCVLTRQRVEIDT